ncbi:MAG TPA: hypothetical protein VNV85_13670 [Puia sp.]|jgi:hypothetical protein|nr:hypothetical protein [Puia sp.]
MENEELTVALKKDLEIDLAEKISFEEIKQKLTEYINHLISHDFQQLITLLYRVDVNENKLRGLLKENQHSDAAEMIAQLILERQLQKIKSRKEFSIKKTKGTSEKEW